MEDKLTKAVEGMRAQNRWSMGLFLGILVALIISITTIGTNQKADNKQLTKINQDYMPYEVVNDLIENTDKYISIVQIISNSAKDDTRYREAIDNRNKFQSEALRRISMSKRSGGSGTNSGSSQ
jgi:hypothetical protein